MRHLKYFSCLFVFWLFLGSLGYSQSPLWVKGTILYNQQPQPNIRVEFGGISTISDTSGIFILGPFTCIDSIQLRIQGEGFQSSLLKVYCEAVDTLYVKYPMEAFRNQIQELVVTATRTSVSKRDAPVLVQVLSQAQMLRLQATQLSDALKFQAGLRIETDCQTCNYTQLRMNGLAGSYAQILLNSRPVFGNLIGLYGLEQFPTQILDRVEVVRGGGSSLYGTSAIAGTVNLITRKPQRDGYEVHSWMQRTASSNEWQTQANLTRVSVDGKLAITALGGIRKRNSYDHNGDGLSEWPELKGGNASLFGVFEPNSRHKIEFNMNAWKEFRYGGEIAVRPAHLASMSEERIHRVGMGTIDYIVRPDPYKMFQGYLAAQITNRSHYTGVFPDDSADAVQHLLNPPYGESKNSSWTAGLQFQFQPQYIFRRSNSFSLGLEYVRDKLHDEVPTYRYRLNQTTSDFGIFAQSIWSFHPRWKNMLGIRIDKHSALKNLVFSPRWAIWFSLNSNTQFRISYGRGFRGPQAFDADMHMAFAGGGISRITLDDKLKMEQSGGWHASLTTDRYRERYAIGFTVEGFVNRLNDLFILSEIGQDSFGTIFQKTNGPDARVYGSTFEFRLAWKKLVQFESSVTWQKSTYFRQVAVTNDINTRHFIKTPDWYGYLTCQNQLHKHWSLNLNGILTGPMSLIRMANGSTRLQDALIRVNAFFELNLKCVFTQSIPRWRQQWEVYVGCRNLFNQYQSDMDTGKHRDSNYFYGPSTPRSYFAGLRIKHQKK